MSHEDMSAWRLQALERFPEFRRLIESAWSPMSLWIELYKQFEKEYKCASRDQNRIKRFYQYAQWCLRTSSRDSHLSDVGAAVVWAFYEHLPLNDAVREDLPRWISVEDFNFLRGAFHYFLGDAKFGEFEAEYLAAKKRAGRK